MITSPARQLLFASVRIRPRQRDTIAEIGAHSFSLVGGTAFHGDPQSPVWIRARNEAGLVLSVSNRGKPIQAETLKRLFLPFTRRRARRHLEQDRDTLYVPDARRIV